MEPEILAQVRAEFHREGLSARRPAAAGVRLTRRGRVVVGSVLLILAFVVFALGRVSAGAAVVAENHTVTVERGDTLWSIATRAAPGTDPRAEVAGLEAVNRIDGGAALAPGQLLFLPTGS